MTDKIIKITLAAALCISVFFLPQQAAAAVFPNGNWVQRERLNRPGTSGAETETMDEGAVEESDFKKAKQNSILPAPEKLEVLKTAYNAVTLSWSEVADAVSYQIEYSTDGDEYTVAGKTPADTVTFKCKKLLAGTTYQFRVCAVDKSSRAGNYISVSAQPCLKKPQIINAGISQLKTAAIEWKKVSGAEKYELYRKQKEENDYQLVTVTSELVYTDDTIITGQSYFYCVRAVRTVNDKPVYSKYSAAAEITVTMPLIQIETCEAAGYNSIKLTWQQSDAVTGYYIYRSVKEDGAYKKIKVIKNNTALSYVDTGVVPGKTFYYKICGYVQAQDQPVVLGEMSDSKMMQTQMPAPNLTAVNKNDSNRSLALSWEGIIDATGYRVFRSLYPDKRFVKIADVAEGTAIGYEDRSVVPGMTYYYRIRALYENKKYKGKSPASDIQQGTAAPAAPIGLKVRQTAADELKISWNKTTGASAYHLYRAETGAGKYTCIAQGIQAVEYTDTDLKDNKTYFYRVSASGADGEGRKCFPVSCLTGGVSLNTRTLKMSVGDAKALELITYRKGRAVWKSSDTAIAEVDSEGMVTGTACGTVTITVTVAGKSASATVTVTPGVKNGIDVSRWQEEVDWCRVKESGIDFAFLRISNHYLEDFTFETKYQDAVSVGMPLGVYCYSRAATVAEAEEEARTVLQILNGRKLDYPIVLDMEDAVHKSAGMTKENLHQMIQGFKQVVENAGYRFVLYSYLNFLNTNLDKEQLTGIDLWIAHYRSLLLGPGYTGTGDVKYWQYNSGQYSGSDFHVDGITDEAGNLVEVDVNVEY